MTSSSSSVTAVEEWSVKTSSADSLEFFLQPPVNAAHFHWQHSHMLAYTYKASHGIYWHKDRHSFGSDASDGLTCWICVCVCLVECSFKFTLMMLMRLCLTVHIGCTPQAFKIHSCSLPNVYSMMSTGHLWRNMCAAHSLWSFVVL